MTFERKPLRVISNRMKVAPMGFTQHVRLTQKVAPASLYIPTVLLAAPGSFAKFTAIRCAPVARQQLGR
jgi:hypothetical protein